MIGAAVELRNVSKAYGALTVLKPTDLRIAAGEFFALLGPSGSGKSTLLGAIAGFVPLTGGRIEVDGRDVTGVPPHRRNLGMVFQNYSLFPFLTVAQNIAFPLEMRRTPKGEIAERVERILGAVRLSHMADRLPSQLSGGQQQRVALARAAVYDPPLLLMDEPLGALDKNLREELQEEIKLFHRQVRATIIYVTHDQHEAAAMADRVAILRDGVLEQIGSPRDLYHAPCNAFVAGFLGEANLLDVSGLSKSGDGLVAVETEQGLRAVAAAANACPGPSMAYIRPENIQLGTSPGGVNAFTGTVMDVVHAAGSMRYRVRLNDKVTVTVRVLNDRRSPPLAIDEKVACWWAPEDMLIVPKT